MELSLDVAEKILLEVNNLNDLPSLCSSNLTFYSICNDNNFWRRKYIYNFGNLPEVKEEQINWKFEYARKYYSDKLKRLGLKYTGDLFLDIKTAAKIGDFITFNRLANNETLKYIDYNNEDIKGGNINIIKRYIEYLLRRDSDSYSLLFQSLSLRIEYALEILHSNYIANYLFNLIIANPGLKKELINPNNSSAGTIMYLAAGNNNFYIFDLLAKGSLGIEKIYQSTWYSAVFEAIKNNHLEMISHILSMYSFRKNSIIKFVEESIVSNNLKVIDILEKYGASPEDILTAIIRLTASGKIENYELIKRYSHLDRKTLTRIAKDLVSERFVEDYAVISNILDILIQNGADTKEIMNTPNIDFIVKTYLSNKLLSSRYRYQYGKKGLVYQ
jgi:hypothetical protein